MCADTLGIIPFLGFLNYLDWWQCCDSDSADDAGDGRTFFAELLIVSKESSREECE